MGAPTPSHSAHTEKIHQDTNLLMRSRAVGSTCPARQVRPLHQARRRGPQKHKSGDSTTQTFEENSMPTQRMQLAKEVTVRNHSQSCEDCRRYNCRPGPNATVPLIFMPTRM